MNKVDIFKQVGYLMAQTAQKSNLTDDEAMKIKSLYRCWKPGESVTAGERIQYNGALYKVLQNHTSQDDWTPDVSPSLFSKVLIPDENVVPEWEQPDSTNPYSKGEKVTHNGKTWESLVDNNVWEPGVTGAESLWKEV